MSNNLTAHRTPGESFVGYSELRVKTCAVCGVLYAAPERLFTEHERNGGSWYCPNGHSLVFIETTEQKLEAERKRRQRAEERAQAERDLREDTERRLSAQKGQTTKARKRAAAALCPCCNRSFVQLRRHMATKHPDYDPAKGT